MTISVRRRDSEQVETKREHHSKFSQCPFCSHILTAGKAVIWDSYYYTKCKRIIKSHEIHVDCGSLEIWNLKLCWRSEGGLEFLYIAHTSKVHYILQNIINWISNSRSFSLLRLWRTRQSSDVPKAGSQTQLPNLELHSFQSFLNFQNKTWWIKQSINNSEVSLSQSECT